jgi:hypothetical protein
MNAVTKYKNADSGVQSVKTNPIVPRMGFINMQGGV